MVVWISSKQSLGSRIVGVSRVGVQASDTTKIYSRYLNVSRNGHFFHSVHPCIHDTVKALIKAPL